MGSYPILSKAGAPTNGVNEVQRLTPGGTISGGTFRLTFEGQQTGDIAWDATAAQVQAALEAISNVGPDDVAVTGGPVQTAFLAVEFTQSLGGSDRTQMTVQSSLTGSAPTLTPSTTTAGVEGSFRGAPVGTKLEDTTNSKIYINTGTAWAPAWTAQPVEDARVLTEATPTDYVDTATHLGAVKLGA
jgi:hypothetical protein